MSRMTLHTVEHASLLTRLDFRPKLVMVAVVTLLAFVWESPLATGGLLLAVVAGSLLAGVAKRYLLLILQVMAPFYLLLLLTHGFWNVEQVKALTGKPALTSLFAFPAQWWLVGGASLSLEGCLYGLNIIFKTLALVMIVPLAIFTTPVDNMIVGLVQAKVPYKLTFIFSATLRFFPVLLEEIQSIIEAQRLRGLAVEKMGPLQRVRVYSKVAVPLILGALVKAQQLEVVLQSKAFTGRPDRTYLHESRLRPLDWAVMGLFVGLLAAAAILYFWLGVGKFAWLLF